MLLAGPVFPSFSVTVWATLSLFVQVTVVPTLTVREEGEKDMFSIETALLAVEDAEAVDMSVGVAVAAVVVELFLFFT